MDPLASLRHIFVPCLAQETELAFISVFEEGKYDRQLEELVQSVD